VGTGIVSTEDDLTFTVDGATTSSLGISASVISGATSSNANAAITAVANAIDTLNQSRSTIGAAQNRLSFAAQNLATAIENAEAARSTLLDLDVAAEMTVFTSKQVLIQTGIAMLAQANQLPQNLLRLFQ
jgi:flagellin